MIYNQIVTWKAFAILAMFFLSVFDVPKVLLTSAPAPYSDLRQGEPLKFYLCHYRPDSVGSLLSVDKNGIDNQNQDF